LAAEAVIHNQGANDEEGFKGRVAPYIERIQFRREAPWTRSALTIHQFCLTKGAGAAGR
jgi:hypothetical protein